MFHRLYVSNVSQDISDLTIIYILQIIRLYLDREFVISFKKLKRYSDLNSQSGTMKFRESTLKIANTKSKPLELIVWWSKWAHRNITNIISIHERPIRSRFLSIVQLFSIWLHAEGFCHLYSLFSAQLEGSDPLRNSNLDISKEKWWNGEWV